MRASVSSGVMLSLQLLGCTRCFDSVYGSSAGAILGTYFVAGQRYVDVYSDLLTGREKDSKRAGNGGDESDRGSFIKRNELFKGVAREFIDRRVGMAVLAIRKGYMRSSTTSGNNSFVVPSDDGEGDGNADGENEKTKTVMSYSWFSKIGRVFKRNNVKDDSGNNNDGNSDGNSVNKNVNSSYFTSSLPTALDLDVVSVKIEEEEIQPRKSIWSSFSKRAIRINKLTSDPVDNNETSTAMAEIASSSFQEDEAASSLNFKPTLANYSEMKYETEDFRKSFYETEGFASNNTASFPIEIAPTSDNSGVIKSMFRKMKCWGSLSSPPPTPSDAELISSLTTSPEVASQNETCSTSTTSNSLKRSVYTLWSSFSNQTLPSSKSPPQPSPPPLQLVPLNLTFVTSSILSPKTGLRPIDMNSFILNNAILPLNIIACGGGEDNFETKVFNQRNHDFFHSYSYSSSNDADADADTDADAGGVVKPTLPSDADAFKDGRCLNSGLFSSLLSSMSVPGLTGSGLKLTPSSNSSSSSSKSKNKSKSNSNYYFDAFLYEAIPLRSLVTSPTPSTHILTIRSKPLPQTTPTPLPTTASFYELTIGARYFRDLGMHEVGGWLERGGSLVRYVEDVFVVREGSSTGDAVGIPPTTVSHCRGLGLDEDKDRESGSEGVKGRKEWKKAFVYMLGNTQLDEDGNENEEVSPLETDRMTILKACRQGFKSGYLEIGKAIGIGFEEEKVDMLCDVIYPTERDEDEDESGARRVFWEGAILDNRRDENENANDLGMFGRFKRLVNDRRRRRRRKKKKIESDETVDYEESEVKRRKDLLIRLLPGLKGDANLMKVLVKRLKGWENKREIERADGIEDEVMEREGRRRIVPDVI